jgi:hypothetical protein
MSIVDLHDCELLHELMINFKFLLSEKRNYLLSQVNGNDVNEYAKILQFFFRLYICKLDLYELTFSIELSMTVASFSFLKSVLIVFLP